MRDAARGRATQEVAPAVAAAANVMVRSTVVLPAPPPRTAWDELRPLLRAWHAEHPSKRLSPDEVALADVESLEVLRVALTSVCEGRGVYVRPVRPVPRLPGQRPVPDVDVWSVEGLELPPDAPIGRRAERVLAGEGVCDCNNCRGAGERRCSTCGGSGTVGGGRSRRRCAACDGRGRTKCFPCNGLGAFAGPVVVWSEIVTTTAVRLVRSEGLPGEVALALDEWLERGGGMRIVEYSGARITREAIASCPRDYRSSAIEAPWIEAALALAAEIDGTGTARIRSQRLEVRRAPACRARTDDGRVWVAWGPPPRVHPPDALDRPESVVRFAFWLGLATFAFIAACWIALR